MIGGQASIFLHFAPNDQLNRACTPRLLKQLYWWRMVTCILLALHSLVYRLRLNLKCLNTPLHGTQSNNRQHPISHLKFVKLISKQLNHNPDNHCIPLWKGGLYGSLFTITPQVYGYTFISKGTIYSSLFKGDIYQKLRHLQGSAILVYLSNIHL